MNILELYEKLKDSYNYDAGHKLRLASVVSYDLIRSRLFFLCRTLLEVHVALSLFFWEGEIGAGGFGAYLAGRVGECGFNGYDVAPLLHDMGTQG